MLRRFIFILISTVFFGVVRAQQSDAEFAEYYYNAQEYKKAILYLEKLYDQQANQSYFDRYLNALIKTESFKEAEKLIKKHYRGNRNAFSELISLATLYQESDPEEADKVFKELSKIELKNQVEINVVVEFLINSKRYQEAFDFYTRHKAIQSTYNYYLTLARIYGALGNTSAMIEQYINMVEENPSYINIVKSSLSRYLDFTQDEILSDALRIALLKAQQKSNYEPAIVELLGWYYIQIQAFDAAFVQLKAAAKRDGLVLERFLELAKTVANNEQLKLSFEIYDYLSKANLPEESKLFIEASRVKYAYAFYQNQSAFAKDQELDIDAIFSNYTARYTLDGGNAFVYIDYADYLFKYQKNPSLALAFCDSIINAPNVYARVIAYAKIKKGDILVAGNDVWEASLLYSQVEKAFKNDDLGSYAKMKNAQIAYYTCDFEWAQAQLDVIKGASSELISNDAIDLSLLITDNLNLDTSGQAMSLYAKSDLMLLQNKTDSAIMLLDSLSAAFPTHSLRDEVLWKKFEIAKKKQDFSQAKEILQAIINEFFFDIYADNALYNLGLLEEEYFNNKDAAIEHYRRLLIDFPNSIFTADARKRLRLLRGDILFEG